MYLNNKVGVQLRSRLLHKGNETICGWLSLANSSGQKQREQEEDRKMAYICRKEGENEAETCFLALHLSFQVFYLRQKRAKNTSNLKQFLNYY